MTTMYEIILNLPLFSGLSENQLSNFLEKTPIAFSQFEAGDVISKKGEIVNTLKCLIGGSVKKSYILSPSKLEIVETIKAPAILYAERLFGMDRTADSNLVCEDKTSVMEISKEQYLKLLQSDHIYLINYLNYLSVRAQSVRDINSYFINRSLKNYLDNLINSYVSRNASSLEIKYDAEFIISYLGITKSSFVQQLKELTNKGIAFTSNDCISIPSKADFLNL